MAKRKIKFNKVKEKSTNIARLGSLQCDFSNMYEDGGVIDFKDYHELKILVRDFVIALEQYAEVNINPHGYRTIQLYASSIKKFLNFFRETSIISINNLSAKDITNEVFCDFKDWLFELNLGSTQKVKIYGRVRRLLEILKLSHPEKIDPDFEPAEKPYIGYTKEEQGVSIYSPGEMKSIVRACVKDINDIQKRLYEGQKLLSEGRDPRGRNNDRDEYGRLIATPSKYAKIENILWYIENVLGGRYLKRNDLLEGHSTLNNVFCGARTEYKTSKCEAYGYLYPFAQDLLPYLVLLAIKTGLNLESLLALKRDCKAPAIYSGACKISYQKNRGADSFYTKTFDDKSRFSPGQIVNEVLHITEPLLEQVNPRYRNRLWVGLTLNSRGIPVKPLEMSYVSFMLNNRDRLKECWTKKHSLVFDDGRPLNISFRSNRKTNITNKYKQKGNLAKVSRDAKHRSTGTTALHYIDSKETQHLHEETIEELQNDIIDLCLGVVLNEEESKTTVEVVLNTDKVTSRNVVSGKQDVFVASCKDFYNSPFGKKGAPCEKPWGCFQCKNAVWTTSILPRVVAFMNFIEEEKSRLREAEWKEKFIIPYIIIKFKILPSFKVETIEWARRVAEEVGLFIPNELRTA